MRYLFRLLQSSWAIPGVVIILGFAPIFWAPLDVMLISEDSALPRVPAQFHLSLHSWNPLLNTGTPYNVAHTAILVFGQQALLQAIGLTPAVAQRAVMILWFMLPGLSMVLLVRTLFGSGRLGDSWKPAALVAASFYMFNLYLENVWLGFNIAVLSAQAVLPAVISLLILAFDRRIGLRRFVLLFAPVALWGSGIGVNPPVVAVVLGAVLLVVVLYPVLTGRWRELAYLGRVGIIFVLGVSTAALVNAFWLIPFVGQLRATSGAEITATAELASTWLQGLSSSTSIPNVLRFQGDWTWYQGWNEPYRAHSTVYQSTFVLQALAWLVPVLALLGSVVRGPSVRHLFTVFAVIGFALSMGTHEPMTQVYLWLVEHVPAFWIVRSPWFKFTLITTIGVAVLIGVTFAQLHVRLRDRPFSPGAWYRFRGALVVLPVIGVMAVNMVYAYPVTTGKIFTTDDDRDYLPHNRVRVPAFVDAASQWIDAESSDGRVAVLPDTTVWANTWGYNGFGPPLTQLGATTPVVYAFSTVFGSLVAATNADLNAVTYDAIYGDKTRRADELLKLMAVRHISHETDIKHWLYAGDTDDPAWVRERLRRQLGVGDPMTFGTWDVYPVTSSLPHTYATDQHVVVAGGLDVLPMLIGSSFLEAPALIFTDREPPRGVSAALTSPDLDSIVLFESGAEELALAEVPSRYRYGVPKRGAPVTFHIDTPGTHSVFLKARRRGQFPSGQLQIDGTSVDLSQESFPGTSFWVHLGDFELASGVHRLDGALDVSVAAELVVVPAHLPRELVEATIKLLRSGTVPVSYVASTERGARPVTAPLDAEDRVVWMAFAENLPTTELVDGDAWRWLTGDGKRALTIENQSETTTLTNIVFKVRSHETPRDLYVYVNEEQQFLGRIPGDRSVDVLLRAVELQPGENVVWFYSPFGGTPVGDRQLTFAVREDSLRAGRLVYEFPLETHVPGPYLLSIRSYGSDGDVDSVSATLDGRPLVLMSRDRLGEGTFELPLNLSVGTQQLAIHQQKAEQYVVRVVPKTLSSGRTHAPTMVDVQHRDPSSVRLRVVTAGPGTLVFGESYDPRWEATTEGQVLQHHVVNGFANGYKIPAAGVYNVSIEFVPQRLFHWGAAISVGSVVVLGIAVIGVLGTRVWSRLRRLTTR